MSHINGYLLYNQIYGGQIMVVLILVLLIGFLLFSAYKYVQAIDYMKENHPDYKGYDLFDETEDDHM